MKRPESHGPSPQEQWQADPARFCFDIGVTLREWEKELLREAMAKRAPKNKWEAKKLDRIQKRIAARLEVLRIENSGGQGEQASADGEDDDAAADRHALPSA
jgi:hypothetical protein